MSEDVSGFIGGLEARKEELESLLATTDSSSSSCVKTLRIVNEIDECHRRIQRLSTSPQNAVDDVLYSPIRAKDIHIQTRTDESSPPSKKARLDLPTRKVSSKAVSRSATDDADEANLLLRLANRSYQCINQHESPLENVFYPLTTFRLHSENLESDSPEDSTQDPYDDDCNITLKIPQAVKAKLFHHQLVAVKFMWNLYRYKIGGLIADEMGLGKTFQTIALLTVLLVNGALLSDSCQEVSFPFLPEYEEKRSSLSQQQFVEGDAVTQNLKVGQTYQPLTNPVAQICSMNCPDPPSAKSSNADCSSPSSSCDSSAGPSLTSTSPDRLAKVKTCPESIDSSEEFRTPTVASSDGSRQFRVGGEYLEQLSDREEILEGEKRRLQPLVKYIRQELKLKPVLIVCPATLISQWRTELDLYYPLIPVYILHGTQAQQKSKLARIKSFGGLCISSYESVRSHLKFFSSVTWFYLILDEGQKIRNPDAQVTQAIKHLKAQNRLLLSGTPIQNDLKEFWSIIDFVQPGRLGTLPVFLESLADPIVRAGIGRVSAALALRGQQCVSVLKSLVAPHMLRRTKLSVASNKTASTNQSLLQVPNKEEQVILCPLSLPQYQVYVDFLLEHNIQAQITNTFVRSSAAEKSTLGASRRRYLRKKGITDFQTKSLWYISVLTKICNHPDLLLLDQDRSRWPTDFGAPSRSGKMTVLEEVLKVWIAAKHKTLIFSQTIQMLDLLALMLGREKIEYLRMDGMTPIYHRQHLVAEFNKSQTVKVMLLTTRVGGVGLNLTGATRVIIFDPDWNPTVDAQAQERAWRIGQNSEVVVHRLVAKGTIEEKIYRRQIYKHFLSEKVLSDSDTEKVFKINDFIDLFAFPPTPKDLKIAKVPESLREVFRKASARQPLLNPLPPTALHQKAHQGFTEVQDATLLGAHENLELEGSSSPAAHESSDNEEGELKGSSPPATAYQGVVHKEDRANDPSPSTSVAAISDDYSSSSDDEGPLRADDGQTSCPESSLFKILFDSDLVDQVLDHKSVLSLSRNIDLLSERMPLAKSALQALRISECNRKAFALDLPTWTGKSGLAGKPVELQVGDSKGNRSLMWTFDEIESKLKDLEKVWDARWKASAMTTGERQIVERLFDFLQGKPGAKCSTGSILMTFGPLVRNEKQKVFLKSVLQKVCDKIEGEPVEWALKSEALDALRSEPETALAKLLKKNDKKKF